MDDAAASGSGSRRNRRKTVSGPVPHNAVADSSETDDDRTPTETMRFPWSTPSAPTSPTTTERTSPTSPKTGHKRTFSNTIFSRLSFLRNNSDEGRPPSRGERPSSRDKEYKEATSPVKSIFSRKSNDDDVKPNRNESPAKVELESVPAAALKQSKTRRRKGSLRKTALMGGRRMLSDSGGKERKGSLTIPQRPPTPSQLQQQTVVEQDSPPLLVSPTGTEQTSEEFPPADASARSLHRSYSYEQPDANSSTESGWSETAAVTTARLALLTDQHKATPITISPNSTTPQLTSPVEIKSPTSQASYTSNTTDEDDLLTFSRPSIPKPLTLPAGANPSTGSSSALPTPSTTSASYFPSPTLHPSSAALQPPTTTTTSKPRPRKPKRSPLSRTLSLSDPTSPSLASAQIDYTTTATYGWIILLSTWLAFTVGMGSCLGIWSWAWDVGETPYAPPELEDDPTLPIVGYYPALVVLTGVVAWVWITVAWVGMKYFRHAKIEV